MIKFLIFLSFAILGGFSRYFFQNPDDLYYSLIALVVCDYFLGMTRSIMLNEFNREKGLKGIGHKIFIFVLVVLFHLIDRVFIMNDIHCAFMLRDAVICYYLPKELFSIYRNFYRLIQNDKFRVA